MNAAQSIEGDRLILALRSFTHATRQAAHGLNAFGNAGLHYLRAEDRRRRRAKRARAKRRARKLRRGWR